MNATEWEKVKALFNEALDKPPGERDKFLVTAAGADTRLGEAVARLLASHDDASMFMEIPAIASHREEQEQLPSDGRVGPYLILREIGRGGMGSVYLAARNDGEFRHKVAIKLVKRGMDTDMILRRFRYERQILADLHHPNIARLLDGGTTGDGRPYFVMEYIEGDPIDVYAAKHDLSIENRLRLFLDVCGAVQFAHQNLVVHRDIKTSNISVTRAGVTKLLDFGIAKLLDASRDEGETHGTLTLRALTPEYASPEQVRGEPVTTASDIYSLGVLLYELLSGRRPYEVDSRSPDAVARVVCDTDPVAPSAALGPQVSESRRRKLKGDLDTIVMKAMQKDPRRRYTSVEHLSEDIERHLKGLPITARRDSTRYRTGKFVRRNRVAVATGFVVILSLVAGLATTMWQARVARSERERAERRFGEVRSLATSFLFDLHDAIAPLPGSTPVRAMLVKQALTSLDGLAREAVGDLTLQRDLAAAYEKIGNVQGNSYNSNLGDTESALTSYRKSMAIRQRLAAENPTSDEMQSDLARAHQGVADMNTVTGHLAEAASGYQKAIAIRVKLLARTPSDQVNRAALADLYNSLGDTQGMDGYANLGDVAGALKSYRRSVDLREAVLSASNTTEARIGLAKSLMNLGFLQGTAGDASASRNVRRAIELLEKAVSEDPNDTNKRLELLAGYVRLRYVLADAGRFDEALAVDDLTIAKLDTMLSADPSNTMLKRNLGATYNYLGRDRRAVQDPARAALAHRHALEIADKLGAADPKSSEHQHDQAMSHFLLGEALSDKLDNGAALDEYRVAARSKERLKVSEPANTRHPDDLALIYLGMSRIHLRIGDLPTAAQEAAKAIPAAEAAVKRSSSNMKARLNLAAGYAVAGELHEELARKATTGAVTREEWTTARAYFAKTAAIWRDLGAARSLTPPQIKSLAHARKEMSVCDSALTARSKSSG